MLIADILIFVIPVALACWAWVYFTRNRDRATANFEAAGRHLGLKAATPVGSEVQAAEGTVQGRKLRLSKTVERHSGGPHGEWVEIHLEIPAAWVFCVRHKQAGRNLLKEFAAAHIATGDPEFDARWDAATDNPAAFAKMLTPELRQLMDVVTASAVNAEFSLENNVLSYLEQADLAGPDILARLDGLAKMLVKLAAAAEAAAK